MAAPTSITAKCPSCGVSIVLQTFGTTGYSQRVVCTGGHRWAVTVAPRGPVDIKGHEAWIHTVTFTPLKPGRSLAAAREDLIKEALRVVPRQRSAEWKRAGPADRARMIKSYVEAHSKEA